MTNFDDIHKQVLSAARGIWDNPHVFAKDSLTQDDSSIYRIVLVSSSFDGQNKDDLVLMVRDKLEEKGALTNPDGIIVVVSPMSRIEYGKSRPKNESKGAMSLAEEKPS